MTRKLLIVPYFGPLPEWFDHWEESVARLDRYGYNYLLDRDEEAFAARVYDRLGLACPPMAGTGKVWDYRPALADLYADEIRGYDFWGHTDMDVVYGRVGEWATEAFLSDLDIHSNHRDYICGFWTLYRNTPVVNTLYRRALSWRGIMEDPTPSGWAETGFTAEVDAAHLAGELQRVYTMWQTRDLDRFDTLRREDGRLMEGDEEVFAAHFRRTKEWPSGC